MFEEFGRRILRGALARWTGQGAASGKVTLPFPQRSRYLSAKGQATFPCGRSLSAFSISCPTHQGTPAQTSTQRMRVLSSYWPFKHYCCTRIKPRHRKRAHRLRHAPDDPPAFKRKRIQDSFRSPAFLVEATTGAEHLLRQNLVFDSRFGKPHFLPALRAFANALFARKIRVERRVAFQASQLHEFFPFSGFEISSINLPFIHVRNKIKNLQRSIFSPLLHSNPVSGIVRAVRYERMSPSAGFVRQRGVFSP